MSFGSNAVYCPEGLNKTPPAPSRSLQPVRGKHEAVLGTRFLQESVQREEKRTLRPKQWVWPVLPKGYSEGNLEASIGAGVSVTGGLVKKRTGAQNSCGDSKELHSPETEVPIRKRQ